MSTRQAERRGAMPLYSCAARPAPSVNVQVVELGDVAIEVRSQGSGEVLVVLSGVGADVSGLDDFGTVVTTRGLRVLAITPG